MPSGKILKILRFTAALIFDLSDQRRQFMNSEIYSENPAVKAIITGTAPRPAQLAAARGILPLSLNDLLEVLVALAKTDDAELAENAQSTLAAQDSSELQN